MNSTLAKTMLVLSLLAIVAAVPVLAQGVVPSSLNGPMSAGTDSGAIVGGHSQNTAGSDLFADRGGRRGGERGWRGGGWYGGGGWHGGGGCDDD